MLISDAPSIECENLRSMILWFLRGCKFLHRPRHTAMAHREVDGAPDEMCGRAKRVSVQL